MDDHALKIDVQPMNDLMSGAKTGEVRKDDRGFQVGDTVTLTCSDGRTAARKITHIQRGYGLPDDICVLSYATHAAEPVPVAVKPVAWAEIYGGRAQGVSLSESRRFNTPLYAHPPRADLASREAAAPQPTPEVEALRMLAASLKEVRALWSIGIDKNPDHLTINNRASAALDAYAALARGSVAEKGER